MKGNLIKNVYLIIWTRTWRQLHMLFSVYIYSSLMTVVGIHRWSCWSDTTAPLPAAADKAAWEAAGSACRRRRRHGHLPLPSWRRRPSPAAARSRTWPLRPWRRPPSRSPPQQTWTSSSSIKPLMVDEATSTPARSIIACSSVCVSNEVMIQELPQLARIYRPRIGSARFLEYGQLHACSRYVCDTAIDTENLTADV